VSGSGDEGLHGAVLSKKLAQLSFGDRERQISAVDLGHWTPAACLHEGRRRKNSGLHGARGKYADVHIIIPTKERAGCRKIDGLSFR
jgi:hypothetical protein